MPGWWLVDDQTRHLADLRRHLDAAGCLWEPDCAGIIREDIACCERHMRDEDARPDQ